MVARAEGWPADLDARAAAVAATPVARNRHEMLMSAYGRPCWICERRGNCPHREPQVEIALDGRTQAYDAICRMEGI